MRRKYLFLDERHVSAGQLAWQTADGRHVPLLAPAEPATGAFTTGPQSVPAGVRLVAQRARRTDPFAVPESMQRLGGASYPLVSYEEGRYTWAVLSDHLPHGRRPGRLFEGAPGQPRRLLPGVAGRLRVDGDQPVPDGGVRPAGVRTEAGS